MISEEAKKIYQSVIMDKGIITTIKDRIEHDESNHIVPYSTAIELYKILTVYLVAGGYNVEKNEEYIKSVLGDQPSISEETDKYDYDRVISLHINNLKNIKDEAYQKDFLISQYGWDNDYVNEISSLLDKLRHTENANYDNALYTAIHMVDNYKSENVIVQYYKSSNKKYVICPKCREITEIPSLYKFYSCSCCGHRMFVVYNDDEKELMDQIDKAEEGE